MSNFSTITIFVAISISGILIMVLLFAEFQTEAIFAKEIAIKSSYIPVTIYKKNDMNVLYKSSSSDASRINIGYAVENISTKNKDANKNMSLLSKNDTTSLDILNNNNVKNISLPMKHSGNHSASSLPSAKTVLIVNGAALLRDKAYSPNPIIIHAQDSIIWKNMDDVVHTVTSGTSFSSPDRGQEFDSGLLGGSYTHKFMKPGIYNYFCQIHPTMIGKIIVK